MNDELSRRLREQVEVHTPGTLPGYDDVVDRRARRHNRRRAGVTAAAVLVVVAGTAGTAAWLDRDGGSGPDDDAPVASETTARPVPTYTWGREPSPVVLRLADRDVSLRASSGCWNYPPKPGATTTGGLCFNGWTEDEDLQPAGDPDQIDFWFGLPGYTFKAELSGLDGPCPRNERARVIATGDQTFRLDPVGLAGRYRVNLYAKGPQGSASYSFEWQTPVDGPLDRPSAYLGWVSGDEDGTNLISYGIELSISDLPTQPTRATASVTATAANGRSVTVELPRGENHVGRCHTLGSVFFALTSGQQGSTAVALGPAPFTYTVDLVLDGERYTGTSVWPDDLIKGAHPYTRLTWSPPLAAYAGE